MLVFLPSHVSSHVNLTRVRWGFYHSFYIYDTRVQQKFSRLKVRTAARKTFLQMPIVSTPRLCSALAAIIALCPGGILAQKLSATALRIDGKHVAPIGSLGADGSFVDTTSPRLSWTATPTDKYVAGSSSRQTGRRLVASSSLAAFNSSNFDVWDSGIVMSQDTLHIAYGGRGLERVGSVVYVGLFILDSDRLSSDRPTGPVAMIRAPARGGPWADAIWLGQTAADWPSDCAQYERDPEPLFRLPIATAPFIGGVTSAHLFITGL